MTESFADITNVAMPVLTDTGVSAGRIVLIAGGVAVVIVLVLIFIEWLEGRDPNEETGGMVIDIRHHENPWKH